MGLYNIFLGSRFFTTGLQKIGNLGMELNWAWDPSYHYTTPTATVEHCFFFYLLLLLLLFNFIILY
jgi:hypothetical protein